MTALPGLASRDLVRTHINAQHVSGGADLLGEIEGGNSIATGDVQNGQSWPKIHLIQQRLGKWRGPIIFPWKRPL
jgi:hypothetical protein